LKPPGPCTAAKYAVAMPPRPSSASKVWRGGVGAADGICREGGNPGSFTIELRRVGIRLEFASRALLPTLVRKGDARRRAASAPRATLNFIVPRAKYASAGIVENPLKKRFRTHMDDHVSDVVETRLSPPPMPGERLTLPGTVDSLVW
jgi:hypothetical protein